MDRCQRVFLDAAAQSRAAVLAVGGPGTGKTTALVEAVVAAAGAGAGLDGLVVLTWSRPAAHRLRAEIIGRLGSTQRAPVMTTVPGWCLALQAAHGGCGEAGALPRLLTGPEQEMQVRELLAGAGEQLWPAELRPALSTRAFTQEVRTGIARARQYGLDPEDLVAMGERTGRAQWIGLGRFFERYLDVLDAQGAWDYAELVHRTRLLLLDEAVAAELAANLRGLYVDEFAEFDRSQLGLLSQVHALGVPVVATADPSTRVFAFRGADPRAVPDFSEHFTAAASPAPQVIAFTEDHRNTPDVLAAVAGVLARNPAESPAARARRAGGAGAGGRGAVSALLRPTGAAQLEAVARWLRSRHVEGVPWSEMAVVGRAGRNQLGAVARALTGLGIPVDVDGADIALGEQPCVRQLIGAAESCLELAENGHVGPPRLLRLVGGPLCPVSPRALRRLRRARGVPGPGADRPLLELIHEAAVRAMDPTDGQAGGADGLPGPDGEGMPGHDAEGPAAASLAGLGTLLGGVARRVRQGAGVQEVLWALWQGTDWPQRLREEALSGTEGSASAHRDLDALCALFDLVARHDRLEGVRGLRILVAEVTGQEISGDQARESDPRGRGVQVITAHRVKGCQWSQVVLIDLVEGAWPGRRGGEGLLAAEAIGDALDVAPGPRDALEASLEWVRQERRLFVLAASRASDSLLVTAVAGEGSEGGEPSRFIAELGVVPESAGSPGARRNSSLEELVGELRRTALDAGSSPALRRAAAERIAALAGARSTRGRRLVPAADPATWWGRGGLSGLRGPAAGPPRPALAVSATGLEKLSRCPRRWFLDSRAGAAEPAGPQAAVGTLIHAMAENSVRLGWDAARQHDCLDEYWDDVGFTIGWQSQSQLRAAHEMIDRLNAWSGTDRGREVIDVEVPVRHRFELPGGTLTLRGTIDRLERETATGRVHVVDFKTGAHAPTRRQVAAHLQLGAYQLAVAEGACSGLTGPHPELGGAELVQLRIPRGTREPGQPKVLAQPGIDDHPFPPGVRKGDGPTWIHDVMAEALDHAASDSWTAVQSDLCRSCPHRGGCPLWTHEEPR